MDSLGPFQERFAKLKEVDYDREKLIEDLLKKVEELERERAVTESKLRHANELVTLYDTRGTETKAELDKALHVMNSNRFVVVLVDGDCMIFRDELVQKGEEGGQEAAAILRTAAMEHVRVQNPDLHPAEVLVRAYANLEGLSKTYIDNKILETPMQFTSFVRGFNTHHTFCDYVDAGKGKECSDEKLKGMLSHLQSPCLKHYVADFHCKYIIFGGSGDNGYARVLGPYSHEEEVRKRITMLEGTPFVHELAALKDKFAVASFGNVFRDRKFPSRRVSLSQSITPPNSPSPKVATYASAVSLSNRLPIALPSGVTQGLDVPFRQPWGTGSHVLKNSKGERIDSILRPNNSLVIDQKKKICNAYQLTGVCTYESQGLKCNFSHVKLNESQMEAQRYIARLSPCDFGLQCEVETCIFGHHCPRPGCRGFGCQFRMEMHNVSRD